MNVGKIPCGGAKVGLAKLEQRFYASAWELAYRLAGEIARGCPFLRVLGKMRFQNFANRQDSLCFFKADVVALKLSPSTLQNPTAYFSLG
jgi:hypothetical protein